MIKCSVAHTIGSPVPFARGADHLQGAVQISSAGPAWGAYGLVSHQDVGGSVKLHTGPNRLTAMSLRLPPRPVCPSWLPPSARHGRDRMHARRQDSGRPPPDMAAHPVLTDGAPSRA